MQSEQEFSQRFAHVIRGVIDFAGLIPGFQLLTQDDKFTLLKAGLFDALFVRLICMFDTHINSIICLNGQIMRRDSIQNGANARFLVDSTFNFAERINSMNLSDTEISLFCAIVLITPDRPGLRNVELVEKMYNKLKECLQAVILQNRPENNDFLRNLLLLLPDLRTLSTLHTEKLVVFRTEHKELLRQHIKVTENDVQKIQTCCDFDTVGMKGLAKKMSNSITNQTLTDKSQNLNAIFTQEVTKNLSSIDCPFRHRANSSSSGDDDIAVTTHLVQNGLTITPVSRSTSLSVSNMKYRKLDSPTDSGIESGNEKLDQKLCSGSSSCSSPRSSLEDQTDEKRHSFEDMPVLKRVLQAPPLYDTNSLMDEAYKPHKKFRAMRPRDIENEMFETKSNQITVVGSTSNISSQLHMHLTRTHEYQQQNSLSSTHSILVRSLKEEPRMSAEQLKRSDMINSYIMREKKTDGVSNQNDISTHNKLCFLSEKVCTNVESTVEQLKNIGGINQYPTSSVNHTLFHAMISETSENSNCSSNSVSSLNVDRQLNNSEHQPLNLSKKTSILSPNSKNVRHILLEA